MEKLDIKGITDTIAYLESIKASVDEIKKYLSLFEEPARANMRMYVSLYCGKNFNDRFTRASLELIDERIESFKRSVRCGKYEDYLNKMTMMQKKTLQITMGLLNKIDLEGEEAVFYRVLEDSIASDIARMGEKEKLEVESSSFRV